MNSNQFVIRVFEPEVGFVDGFSVGSLVGSEDGAIASFVVWMLCVMYVSTTISHVSG